MGDYIEALSDAPTTCFTCTRVNPSTFLVVEDDKYLEQPFIYVKVTLHALVVIDTGCGGAARDQHVKLTCLKDFLETFPVPDNNNEPLNEGGCKPYVVICTHCHYDHILGVEPFTAVPETRICASSYDRAFLSVENLPEHSLCNALNIQTPKYTITDWADDAALVKYHQTNLGVRTYHTPGHTPDELAIFDEEERVLYVGDTIYEWAPIIFPKEGNIITFSSSLAKLRNLVDDLNSDPSKQHVAIACGHCTKDADAEELLRDVDLFLWNVVSGQVEVKERMERRGEENWLYEQDGARLSFRGPARLFETFRRDNKAMKHLRDRIRHGSSH